MNPEHYSMSIQWSEPDQVYIVTVPELPGCRTHGETYQEAVAMGLEAIAGWLEAAKDAGWPIPPPHIIAA